MNSGYVLVDFLNSLGCLGGVGGNLRGGSALLFHGGVDGAYNVVDIGDHLRDFVDALDGAFGAALDVGDLLRDLRRGLAGLFGQFLDLVGGVESQQVDLFGDSVMVSTTLPMPWDACPNPFIRPEVSLALFTA